MDKIKIEYEKPENLIPYHHNSKIHSDDQILRLCSSIAEYGFDQPIVVDKNKVIIKGHGRREAAIKLALKHVPIVVADHLDEYQVKAARIADNKTSSTEYNQEYLKFDLGTLHLAEYNMNLTGLPEFEIESFLKDLESGDGKMSDDILQEFNRIQDGELSTSDENSNKLDQNNNVYSDKIEIPIYEPKGEKPNLNDLIDVSKHRSLCKEIEQSKLSKEEKEFLLLAASRHIVFNYEKIADYYAHSNKETQELFENSALVIIDFEKAVQNGFVKLSKEMNESYLENEQLDEE